jgi:putative ABC transport system permease protein
MLRNYCAAAFRNLLKYKLFSAINIGGLSVGLAACLLIALYVQDEISYDRQWTNADRIYRVTTTIDRTGSNPVKAGVNSLLLLPALKQYFSEEIESGSRMLRSTRDFHIDSAVFRETVATVDADFIRMFELDVLDGSLQTVLSDPNSIALSDELAQRFFAEEKVVDRVITLSSGDTTRDYRIGAVYRLPPGNTVLDLPALMPLDTAGRGSSWLGPLVSQDFVQLRPGINHSQIETRLPEFIDLNVDISALQAGPAVTSSQRVSIELQNVGDIYLNSPFERGSNRGNKTVVVAFSAIAILVLLIGCINFTILSTARATQRAREVAVRKVIGASRSQLSLQFLGESFLVVLPAILLALVLVELMLPFFESIVGRTLAFSYGSPTAWLSLFALALIVGFAGGLYPAFLLSRFKPVTTLKGLTATKTRGAVSMSNVLVAFQFSISIALIIATAVIYAQVSYTQNHDPGFNGDNMLIIENLGEPRLVNASVAEKNTLKAELADLANVSAASLSGHQPMQRSGSAIVPLPFSRLDQPGITNQLTTLSVDHDFFRTWQISLVAGRDYSQTLDRATPLFRPEYDAGTSDGNLIVNASAVRSLGFASVEDAIGARVSSPGFNAGIHNFTIVGVTEDTQFSSLRGLPAPEAYVLYPEEPGYMMNVLGVRFVGDPQVLLADVSRIWRTVIGDQPLETSFAEERMAGEFEQERTEASMLVSFSFLAIIIACLGLYGSATFNVHRRTREIGIRKVMGAEVREIVTLLIWQFSRPVMFANVIAWPAALWVMITWLQRFAYRIDIWLLLPLCAAAGTGALMIAWLTVAGNTLRVASISPVKSLRVYE